MSVGAPPLMTAEEFGRRPQPADGSKEELVKGVVVTMPPPKARHGIIQVRISRKIGNFVDERRLGWVVAESGTVLERDPDTLRGPDVAFYSITRQPTEPEGYFEIAPDLAVEILSPDDRRRAVRVKIREYITAGVPLIWLVDPEGQTVTVYAGSLRGIEYDEADTLDGGDVLPGFACRVGDFFQ